MEIIRLVCPLCGGDISLSLDESKGVCLACDAPFYFSKKKSAEKIMLFNHANLLRRRGDFEGALLVYADLLALDDSDAEVYWGIVLCTYGIEYVLDPITLKNTPTSHRAVEQSVFFDKNYLKAVALASPPQREAYRKEAMTIDKIQESILLKLSIEPDYDVFICFKSAHDDGSPTEDRLIAARIYSALTAQGIKTFFSEVTLKDKLGSDYEPIIHKALYSAKVMILVATDQSHINSVWVRNEWARFSKRVHDENLTAASFAVFKNIKPSSLPPIFRTQGLNLANASPYSYPKEIATTLAARFGTPTTTSASTAANTNATTASATATTATSASATTASSGAVYGSALGGGGNFSKAAGGSGDEGAKAGKGSKARGKVDVSGLNRDEVTREISELLRDRAHYEGVRDRAQNTLNSERAGTRRTSLQRKEFEREQERLKRILSTPNYYAKRRRQAINRDVWLRILFSVFLIIFSSPLVERLGVSGGWRHGLAVATIIVCGLALIWYEQFAPPNQSKIDRRIKLDTEREMLLREKIIQCDVLLTSQTAKIEKAKATFDSATLRLEEIEDKLSAFSLAYDYADRVQERISSSLAHKISTTIADKLSAASESLENLK